MGDEKRITEEQLGVEGKESDAKSEWHTDETPDVEGHIVRVSPPVDHKGRQKGRHKGRQKGR